MARKEQKERNGSTGRWRKKIDIGVVLFLLMKLRREPTTEAKNQITL